MLDVAEAGPAGELVSHCCGRDVQFVVAAVPSLSAPMQGRTLHRTERRASPDSSDAAVVRSQHR